MHFSTFLCGFASVWYIYPIHKRYDICILFHAIIGKTKIRSMFCWSKVKEGTKKPKKFRRAHCSRNTNIGMFNCCFSQIIIASKTIYFCTLYLFLASTVDLVIIWMTKFCMTLQRGKKLFYRIKSSAPLPTKFWNLLS